MKDFDWNEHTFTESQVKIANYIQKHIQHVLISTEQEIAREVGVSIATVSRFWRVIGFQNLKSFKTAIRHELEVSPAGKIKKVKITDSASNLYLTMEKSIGLLQETIDHLESDQFKQAISLLRRARRIRVLALGPSKGLGELLVYRMTRFGMDIQLIRNQGNELFEDMIHLKREDLLIIFAFTRLLPEAKVLLSYQREIHYHSLLITDQLIADFTSLATMTLFASRGDANEFHSMIAPTLLVENLVLALGMENKQDNIKKLEHLSDLRKKYEKELPR